MANATALPHRRPPKQKPRSPPCPLRAASSRAGWISRSRATTRSRSASSVRLEADRLSKSPLLGAERAFVRPLVVPNVNLPRTRDLLLLVLQHLFPLREPSRGPRDREQDRKEVGGKLHRPVDEPGVEVHVRVQLARREVVVGQCDQIGRAHV